MAVIKIEDIYLYVSTVDGNHLENLQANAFMDHSGISYLKYRVDTPDIVENLLKSINSWWTGRTDRPEFNLPPITSFPFVTYTEVHDDVPARLSPVKYLTGIDAIKTLPNLIAQTS